jgi:hypothetical protein
MKGALTVLQLDELKRKARNLDEAEEFLKGRIDSELALTVWDILHRGGTANTQEEAG